MLNSIPMRKPPFYLLMFLLLLGCSREDASPGWEFEGETLAEFRFGGSGGDSPRKVIPTLDGGFAILGFTNSVDGDLTGKKLAVNDYWLLKLDVEGQLEWSRTIGGSGDDQGQSLTQLRDGGFALVGYAMSSDGDGSQNMGFHDNWVVRLDASGEILWERSFGYAGHDHAYDVVETRDGGLLFVGFLDVTASGGEGNDRRDPALTAHGVGEFWVTRLDPAGNIVWRRYFGGTDNDRAYAVATVPSGGFLVAGAAESANFDIGDARGSYDFWVLRLSEDGDLLWERSLGGSGIDRAYEIARTADGHFLVGGNTFSADGDVSRNHGGSDIWVVKLSEQGEVIWEQTYGGSGFDALESIMPDNAGGVLLSGNSRSSDGDLERNEGENDIWVLRIDGQGRVLWQRSFGGPYEDFGFSAAQSLHGRILVVGEAREFIGSGPPALGDGDLWGIFLE